MDPLNPPAVYGEVVAGRQAASETLRQRIRFLASDLTRNTFDIAEAFLQAQETGCYHDWGFASLGEYAVAELGIKSRKAQYLARIVKVCREVGVARADYEQVPITSLREITTLDPASKYYNPETKVWEPMEDHIVRLLAEGPELSTVEVEDAVNQLKGMTGDNAMVIRRYKVTQSSWDNVIMRCFEAVRKLLGSKGRDGTGAAVEYPDGTVIETLCAEWNADPRNFLEETNESQIETPMEEQP